MLLLLRPNLGPFPPLPTVFWIILYRLTSSILLPSPSTTVWLRFTAMLHPTLYLSSGIGSTVHLDIARSRQLPTPVPALLFFSTLDMIPSVLLGPWITAPWVRLCCLCLQQPPPPFFAGLNVTSVPVGSSRFYLSQVHPYAYAAPVWSLPLSPSTCRPLPL